MYRLAEDKQVVVFTFTHSLLWLSACFYSRLCVLTVLLRGNSYTIQFMYFQYTTQWLMMCLQSSESISTIIEHFHLF